MKTRLLSFFFLFSLFVNAQDEGTIVTINILNAPADLIDVNLCFEEENDDNIDCYTVPYSPNGLNTWFIGEIEWSSGTASINDCDGSVLTAPIEELDTLGYTHYVEFFYCESDSIWGCTDPNALNYNAFANIDDGSCFYSGPDNDLCAGAAPLDTGLTLIDNTFAVNNEDIFGECWNFGSGEGEQSSLWFSFTTPSEPAQFHIEAIGDGTGTLTDTQFGLFEECGGEMIYCDGNSGAGLLSAFSFSCGELDTNATYILMVDGWNGDAGTCFLSYEVTNPCDEPVFGCTDPLAVNYNPDATIDDGSCTYTCSNTFIGVEFVTNTPLDSIYVEWAIYDANGEDVENGYFDQWAPQYALCLEDGCYTLEMINWFGEWEGFYSIFTFDGNQIFGEFDSSLDLTVVEFGINTPGCGEDIEGCTDPEALNYDPWATIDDGSCEYFECDANTLVLDLNTQNWGYEISWNITDINGNEVWGGSGYESYSTTSESICLEDGCYIFEMYDSFGDGWNDAVFTLSMGDAVLASGTLPEGEFGQVIFGVNEDGCEIEDVFGCTDPTAYNYNPLATIDDGSCEYECTTVTFGVDITAGSPSDDDFMTWILIDQETDMPVDTGEFEAWGGLYTFCLMDGCYTLLIENIPSDWAGVYSLMSWNVFLNGGEFDDNDGSVEIHFGVNAEGCGDEEEPVFGCTDPDAINYNPDANVDDGSCEYEFECESNTLVFTLATENWGQEISWNISDENGNEVAGNSGYESYSTFSELICLEDGCYTFEMFDSFGDGWNDAEFVISMGDEILASGTLPEGEYGEVNFGVNEDGCDSVEQVFGCTDPAAINYNPFATVDDGSCEYDDFECGISFEVYADSTGSNTFFILPSENIFSADSVLWVFGDGHTSTDFFPTHVYEGDGPYTLCLFVTFSDDNGNFCSISFCQELDGSEFGEDGFLSEGFTVNVVAPGTLDTDNPRDQIELSVYPNPTTDIVSVSFQTSNVDQMLLRLVDLQGKVLDQKVIGTSNTMEVIEFDLSEYPKGLYLISLEGDDSINHAKVVRQ